MELTKEEARKLLDALSAASCDKWNEKVAIWQKQARKAIIVVGAFYASVILFFAYGLVYFC
jgi:hypothetical protein